MLLKSLLVMGTGFAKCTQMSYTGRCGTSKIQGNSYDIFLNNALR